MTLGTTQVGWGCAAVTNKTTISVAQNTHLRVSWHICTLGARLAEARFWHVPLQYCSRRKMIWLTGGDWLLKFLPSRDITTFLHMSWAKSVTWFPRGRVWEETSNVWWTVLATVKPGGMQRCVALWGGGPTPRLQSWWVGPGFLAAAWGQLTHSSGPGCQKNPGVSPTHLV